MLDKTECPPFGVPHEMMNAPVSMILCINSSLEREGIQKGFSTTDDKTQNNSDGRKSAFKHHLSPSSTFHSATLNTTLIPSAALNPVDININPFRGDGVANKICSARHEVINNLAESEECMGVYRGGMALTYRGEATLTSTSTGEMVCLSLPLA